jgi:hypothetical protein
MKPEVQLLTPGLGTVQHAKVLLSPLELPSQLA